MNPLTIIIFATWFMFSNLMVEAVNSTSIIPAPVQAEVCAGQFQLSTALNEKWLDALGVNYRPLSKPD